jgi:hypothetical protein
MTSFMANDVNLGLLETVEITADHNFGEPHLEVKPAALLKLLPIPKLPPKRKKREE